VLDEVGLSDRPNVADEVGDARSAMAKAVEAESDFPFSMSYCASTCKLCVCVCVW
jgi:hypothetical protein